MKQARLPGHSHREVTNPGIYLGTVTSVDFPAAVAYVEVPRLNEGFEYPARFARDLLPPAGAASATGPDGDHVHAAPTATTGLTSVDSHTHGSGSQSTLATGHPRWADKAGLDHTHDATGDTGPAGGHNHTATTTVAAIPHSGQHTHTLPVVDDSLAAGDEVAVAFVEGGRDELVILLRLASPSSP